MTTATPTPNSAATQDAGQYTRKQRFLLWLISTAGTLAVRLIGMTLRISIHLEPGAPPFDTHPLILCFWHRAIFTSTWAFRDQKIGVITSQSFDGEYIARIISAFGYSPIRGSSSRGGVRALLESRRLLEQGRSVAFTSDGPRGPVFVAKPGPVLLASKSEIPLVAFHIAVERSWRLKTWDQFVIPKPFSRALLCMGAAIKIPSGLDELESNRYHAQLQAAQERVRDFAEANAGKINSPMAR